MLQLRTEFPMPGAIALFEGLRWRIFQHVGDQAIITREGPAFGLTRRAPIDELVDPVEADHNALLPYTDMSAATARIALFAAKLLRDCNEVALRDLGTQLAMAAEQGRVPRYTDNSHLTRVMRRLGWRKDGYAGAGYDRSPRYVRVSTAARAA
tara:strand:- start:985 stop:1443 length:459 start_codon:yes stop_codon:yes gene_type:complete